jgi:hypothetical protein
VTTSKFTALTTILIACGMAVSAQAQSANAPVTVSPAVVRPPIPHGADPNEVVCKRRGEPGHLGAHKLCGTRAQWEQVARDSAEALTKVQNAGNFAANPMDNGMGHGMGMGPGGH